MVRPFQFHTTNDPRAMHYKSIIVGMIDSGRICWTKSLCACLAYRTARIHRVAGLTGDRSALVTTRPCRAPHHTISDVGLIGGGHVPMPGEVSRAHYGVRCLDARPKCRRLCSKSCINYWKTSLQINRGSDVIDFVASATLAIGTRVSETQLAPSHITPRHLAILSHQKSLATLP
jgi:hypothetical protein